MKCLCAIVQQQEGQWHRAVWHWSCQEIASLFAAQDSTSMVSLAKHGRMDDGTPNLTIASYFGNA